MANAWFGCFGLFLGLGEEMPSLVRAEFYVQDSRVFRAVVVISVMTALTMALLSLLLLPMCPAGPHEARAVGKRTSGRCGARALCASGVCCLVSALVAAFVLGILAVHPDTSCYRIFGGAGC
jgi:hypothetical protein